jgi:drug/metabolite transporter (DMT)-like permease
MTKILLILIVALCLEAVGVVLLRNGLKKVDEQMSQVQKPFLARTLHSIRLGVKQWTVVLGVVFEAVFFAALLYLLSQRDVSVIWPLTALGFVVTTFAAKIYLHEHVPGLRWAGVCLIVLGAALITWSEQMKGKAPELPPPVSTELDTH